MSPKGHNNYNDKNVLISMRRARTSSVITIIIILITALETTTTSISITATSTTTDSVRFPDPGRRGPHSVCGTLLST